MDGPLCSEDGDGVSVLHVACQLADNDDVLGHLLSSGALVNARDRRGRTPLHYAVDTDQPRYCGATPLTHARRLHFTTSCTTGCTTSRGTAVPRR